MMLRSRVTRAAGTVVCRVSRRVTAPEWFPTELSRGGDNPHMSFVQRLVQKLASERSARDIEAESRDWMITCTQCRASRSVWDYGGIRWKARGTARMRAKCETCGTRT